MGTYHHGQLREALIKAAVEIVEAEGVAGLTLRKAARRAGVSHAAPGHHFGDLRGLLAAVATEGLRTLHAALVGAYEAAPEHAHKERLQATGLAYVAWAVQAPGCFRATFHPALADRSRDAELEEASQATFGVLVEAIVACPGRGCRPRGRYRRSWRSPPGRWCMDWRCWRWTISSGARASGRIRGSWPRP